MRRMPKDMGGKAGREHYSHMEPGGGGRFAALKAKLGKRKGVKDPGALAGFIGRRKYGKAKMARWSAKGRARS